MKERKGMITAKLTAAFIFVFALFPVLYANGQTKFGDKTAPFFKTFSSGTYHMKAKTVSGGTATEMELYYKGGMTAVAMVEEGESMRIVVKDKKAYMIFETSKMILIAPSQAADDFKGIEPDKIKLNGSGTAVFAGKSLPYDEYLETDGSKTQYFVDGNKLAGMRSISKEGTTDTIISVLDQNVPNNVFDIPSASSGYMIQDMSS